MSISTLSVVRQGALGTVPRISYLHLRGQPETVVLRVLRSLGVGYDLHNDLRTALAQPPGDVMIVRLDALADGELEELDRVVRRGDLRARLLLLSEHVDSRRLGALLLSGRLVTNVLSGDLASQSEDLRVTLQKVLRDDLFGVEKYFGWGVEFRKFRITRSSERSDVLAEAERLAAYVGLQPRLVSMFRNVVEELSTNALYNAPTDDAGNPRFRHLPRDQEVVLSPSEAIEVTLATDGSRLATGVLDPFGSLVEETLRRRLGQHLSAQSREVDTESGGAGLGLSSTVDSLAQLVINVEPQHRTEMIGLLPVVRTYRDFAAVRKSFNLFIRSADRAPRWRGGSAGGPRT